MAGVVGIRLLKRELKRDTFKLEVMPSIEAYEAKYSPGNYASHPTAMPVACIKSNDAYQAAREIIRDLLSSYDIDNVDDNGVFVSSAGLSNIRELCVEGSQENA